MGELHSLRLRNYNRRMNKTRWWIYVEAVTDGAPHVEIARKAEFDPSAISRWKRGDKADVAFALKFARAYKRNVLEALVEAEVITEAEAKLHEVKAAVGDLTTVELLEEALHRIR